MGGSGSDKITRPASSSRSTFQAGGLRSLFAYDHPFHDNPMHAPQRLIRINIVSPRHLFRVVHIRSQNNDLPAEDQARNGMPSGAPYRHQLGRVLLELCRRLLNSLGFSGSLDLANPCLFGGELVDGPHGRRWRWLRLARHAATIGRERNRARNSVPRGLFSTPSLGEGWSLHRREP